MSQAHYSPYAAPRHHVRRNTWGETVPVWMANNNNYYQIPQLNPRLQGATLGTPLTTTAPTGVTAVLNEDGTMTPIAQNISVRPPSSAVATTLFPSDELNLEVLPSENYYGANEKTQLVHGVLNNTNEVFNTMVANLTNPNFPTLSMMEEVGKIQKLGDGIEEVKILANKRKNDATSQQAILEENKTIAKGVLDNVERAEIVEAFLKHLLEFRTNPSHKYPLECLQIDLMTLKFQFEVAPNRPHRPRDDVSADELGIIFCLTGNDIDNKFDEKTTDTVLQAFSELQVVAPGRAMTMYLDEKVEESELVSNFKTSQMYTRLDRVPLKIKKTYVKLLACREAFELELAEHAGCAFSYSGSDPADGWIPHLDIAVRAIKDVFLKDYEEKAPMDTFKAHLVNEIKKTPDEFKERQCCEKFVTQMQIPALMVAAAKFCDDNVREWKKVSKEDPHAVNAVKAALAPLINKHYEAAEEVAAEVFGPSG